jgi:glycosyltransferase involved in cell wall biosynthesis
VALTDVTPVILTFNEEENIARTLESLRASPRVVVVDSESQDRTEGLARSFPNVAWYSRAWSGFRDQWQFAFEETEISTPFVLALDADMQVTSELESEIAATAERRDVDGATMAFEYRIRGGALAGSLYPRQLRLLRTAKAQFGERGHAHHLEVAGRVVALSARLVHDDRKPLEMFVRAQVGYSARELPRLFEGETVGLPARVRRSFPFTPLAVWAWAWLRAGGPLLGAAARRYALERLIYEAMLRWRVEDTLLTGSVKSEDERES